MIELTDKVRGAELGKIERKKLKGHVKITLTDINDGSKTEVEGDNIVTDFLDDVLASNYLSALNLGAMLPLADTWLAGVLAFRNQFSTVTIDGNVVPDPAKYYIEGDDTNPLIAHAGDTAPATAAIVAQDYKRGSPAGVVKTANSLKYTWSFLPSQGNGIINSIALTHVHVGNAGTGNTSDAFKALQPFASIGNLDSATASVNNVNNVFAQYDDNHAIWFHIGQPSEFYSGHTCFKTKDLTIILSRLPYKKVGLWELMSNLDDYQETVTVTLSGYFLYNQPSYHFDHDNKKLWIFSNTTSITDGYNTQTYDAQVVQYAVIDVSDFANATIESEGTITSNASDLAPMSMEKYPNRSYATDNSRFRNANIIKDGNLVYLPTTSGVSWGSGTGAISKFNVNGFKVIDITDQGGTQGVISYNEVQEQFKSAMKCGGLIINSGRVINNGVGYTCASQLSEAETIPCYAIHEAENAASVVTYLGAGSSSVSANRYILAPKLVLTTKYNLPSQVEKTGTQAMTIEYTLTET